MFNNISSFLNIRQGTSFKKEIEKLLIIEQIKEITSIELPTKSVLFKNGTLTLSVKPIVKSELKAKEKEIMEVLKGKNITISKII